MKYFKIKMKKMKKLFFIIAYFFTQNTFCQTVIIQNRVVFPVKMFKTSDDFVKNDTAKVQVLAQFRQPFTADSISNPDENKDGFIQIKKFINISDMKTNKEVTNYWAIKYKESIYVNLGYSDDLNNWKAWIKPDVIGHYILAYILPKDPRNRLIGNTNYGMPGLGNILMNNSKSWGKNFKNISGQNVKIVLFNTNKNIPESGNRLNSCNGNLLTKDDLKELSLKHNVKINDDATFEEVVTFFEKINSKIYN